MSIYSKRRSDGATIWSFRFMYQGNRYGAVGGSTKTQALRAEAKMRDDVISGRFKLVRPSRNPKIEEFAKIYLERRKHLRSREREDLAVRIVLKYFKGNTLSSIKPSDIEDYIVHRRSTRAYRRRNNVANGTINRELACLKHMFNMAVKWGDACENPMNDVKLLEEPPGRTRYLSKDEVKILLSHCSTCLRPVVLTALLTGMRLNEILKLKWSQIHFEQINGSYIEITRAKNNKRRTIPLNKDMVELLENLSHFQSEFVFLGTRGRPFKTLRKSFMNAVKRAEISDFSFHDLRHTFASHFMMSGGDILSLKEILGHSSLQMVQRYSHLADYHKRQQMDNLTGIFSNCHLFATTMKKASNS